MDEVGVDGEEGKEGRRRRICLKGEEGQGNWI
jgi:hypothetical protein